MNWKPQIEHPPAQSQPTTEDRLRDAAVIKSSGFLPSRKLYTEAADEIAALRAKVDELTAALREARAHVADTTLAAGTPAYVKCCRALMAIDDALALNSQERG